MDFSILKQNLENKRYVVKTFENSCDAVNYLKGNL